MERAEIYEQRIVAPSYDLDANGQVKPGAICRYFQEAAAVHATTWDLGAEHLGPQGKFWVLARLAVHVGRPAQWRDELRLTTWSRGPDRLLAWRDFALAAADGSLVAAGSSGWLIVDLRTRRPQRLSHQTVAMPHLGERHAIDPAEITTAMETMETPKDAETQMRQVEWNDLDLNQHVNNTRYLDWAIDAYPAEFWRTHRVERVVANYLAETRAGETVAIVRRGEEISVMNQKTGKEACRMRLSCIKQEA